MMAMLSEVVWRSRHGMKARFPTIKKTSLVSIHIGSLEKSDGRLLCGVDNIGNQYVDRSSFAAEHAQLRGVVPLHIESRESSLRAACYFMTLT
jgi:hypothetical protein